MSLWLACGFVPSAFAHALVGASLATVLPRSRSSVWIPLGLALAAAAPDLDVLAFGFGFPYEHPLGHRGFTHSVLFAAMVAVLSMPMWARALPGRFRLAGLLTFLAIASHGALDAFTNGGLGVGFLIPFENGRYFAPWRPIQVSPLSVGAFFGGRGLAVIASEAMWVGLPCGGLVAFLAIIRASRLDRTE
jgi:inner membrane protein